ncbi:MAG: hypothetical protein CML20_05430 [Rheinheimera sp.]|uniref:hypothetical protein n=1 Tax=Arsukibacterium sp. UBA3155 TaxID=1946058 RepID=UPI000C91998C|nr:hypothetical protein [Arsukibacterium sp. UBA3155]MAD74228.1 hypothetical protein [Rheinheimera sp.]|tara:strand:+ start:97589 stop:97837 length:249 start_codon:yes stop_codon:yes gene_type:complete
MIKALKIIVVTASISLASTASSINDSMTENESLYIDDLLVCSFWPTCRDPDQQKPVPSDSSAPKPSGDKDTTKDKKDEVQLA